MRRLRGTVVLGVVIVLVSTVDGARKDDTKPGAPQQVSAVIDRMIAQRLAEEKIVASEQASDQEFLRRVYIDITGRIPTTEKAIAFLDSTDANKRAKLIDELLASKDYGQHFGTIWRNLIIRPDANMLRPPDSTPLVNWLADQFNRNNGWDKIVHEMLTVEGAKPEGLFFVLNGDSRGNPQANVLAGSVGQLFMGVQLACAECHNHPFDDTWKQTDFWGVAAFFGKVKAAGGAKGRFAGQNITESSKAKAGKRNMAPKTVGSTIVIPDSAFKQIGKRVAAQFPGGTTADLAKAASFRPALAAWLTSKDNPYFARNAVNRLWGHFFGKAFSNPVGETSEANPPSHPDLLDALTAEFTRSGFDQKHLIRCICNSQTYQRSSRPTPSNRIENHLFARMDIKVIGPEVLYDTLCQSLSVDSLVPVRAKAPAKKKKKGNNNRFPVASAKQKFINFYTTRDAEGDTTEFTHGIPQALRLMNQDLFNSGGNTVSQAVKAGGGPDKVVERMYLAVLSRRPTTEELKDMIAYVNKQKEPTDGYRGVFWALINSAEFMINR